MRHRVLRNLRTLGGGSAVASVLALLATMANSRALSITDFGTLVLLQASALLLAGLTTLSPQQPIIKMGVSALNEGDTERFEGLIALGLAVDVAAALVAGGIALALVLWLPGLIDLPSDRIAPALIVAASLFLQGYKTSEGIFRAFNRFDLLAWTLVAAGIVQLTLALVLWATDAAFVWYSVLAALVLALPSMLQLALALHVMRQNGLRMHRDAVRAARRDLREFAHYCWVTGVTGSLDSLRMNGDAALVGLLVSVEGAGLYGVAKQISGVVRKATVIYASVLFPELAQLAARRDSTGLARLLRTATAAALIVTGGLTLGTWLLGELALETLFGPAFISANFVMIVLVGAAGLQIASATYSMAVQAFINPTALLKAYLFASFAFLLTVWPALRLFGPVGAGLSQIMFALGLGLACALLLKTKGAKGGAADAN
jgi:O-antigen/teichoic acid export membrane protein